MATKIIYMCAGIIVLNENNPQNPEILLGMSARKPCWGGFGGHRQSHESWEEAAAREFYEETMGCVDPFFGSSADGKDDIGGRIDKMVTFLMERKYVTCIINKTSWSESRYYVVPIATRCPDDCMNFSNRRQILKGAGGMVTSSYCGHYLEKRSIQWFSIDKLVPNVFCTRDIRFQESFLCTLVSVMVFIIKRRIRSD